MAPIGVGSTLPDGQLAWFDESDQLQQVSISSLAAGKKVILFGVPGAFTPTCSMQHVPGFVTQSEELKAKGVDEILLVSGHGHAHPWPGRTGKGRYLNGGSKLWMLTAAAASGRRCGRQQHVMDGGIRVHAGGSSAGMSLSLSWTLRRSQTGVVARSGGHAAWEGGRGGSGIAASGKGAVVEEAGRGGAPGASIP